MSKRRPATVAARALSAAFLAVFVLLGSSAVALAASVTFGTPTATSKFGQGIDFNQPYTTSATVTRAEISIDYPGAVGPSVTEVELVGGGQLHYRLSTSTGGLMPNETLVARWQLTLSDGSIQTGPDVSVTYSDDRFSWKTTTNGLIRMHWYQFSASQGKDFAAIGAKGLAKAVSYIGFDETAPIDVFVYPDQQDFMESLGPGTTENVGGLANEGARTCYALIEPSYVAFGDSVIPHELAHVVFRDATRNPYSSPPHWLNEGMATYLADGYDSSNRALVRNAIADGTLMPLKAIPGDFPASRDRFALAYAEAVSAVSFFVDKYGKPAMNKLMQTYGTGSSDDEAFQAAIGMDLDAFDEIWLTSLGVTSTPTYGPLPAPTGPLPSDWVGSGASPGPTGTPGETAGAETPTARPTAMATTGGQQPATPRSRHDVTLQVVLIAIMLAGIAFVLLGIAIGLHRRATKARGG